jgi:hypothetical protein
MKPGQLASRTIDAEYGLAALRDAQVLLHRIGFVPQMWARSRRGDDVGSCRSSLLRSSDESQQPRGRGFRLCRQIALIKSVSPEFPHCPGFVLTSSGA